MTQPTSVPTAGVSPTIVGLLRGLLYAALAAVASAVIAFTGGLDAETLGRYAWAVPVLAAGARWLEGYIDKVRGQAPQVPTGSKPADPAAYVPAAAAVLEVAPPPARSRDDLELDIAAAIKQAMPRAQDSTVTRVAAVVAGAITP